MAESAERSELHRLCQLVDLFEILDRAVSLGDAVHKIVELLTAFPARGAFSAGLTAEEIKVVEHDVDNTVPSRPPDADTESISRFMSI